MKNEIKKTEPRTLPGFMELLPSDQIVFNKMMDNIRGVYEKFGFLPIDTPIIESSEVILANVAGETEKQIYRFKKGESELALRFDLTVPLAKYVVKNYNDLSFPFKRYQIGKVYRGEKPQKGRYREFYQCDIDIVGDETLSVINDAEILNVIYNLFNELKFDDFTILINNRKVLNGLFEDLNIKDISMNVLRTIDKIDKIGKNEVYNELEKLNILKANIDKIIGFILFEGSNDEKLEYLKSMNIKNDMFVKGLTELEEVVRYIRMFNVPEKNYKIDFKIARGLDYYTGTVYETFLNKYREIGSICSGGRYEDLAENFTNKKMPGVGISIGLTRLFSVLDELKLIDTENESISKALIIPLSDDFSDAILVANQLRSNNINSEIYLEDKKIKAKMKYANALNVPYTIIIGEDEVKLKKYTIRNMKTGEEDKLSIDDIISMIKNS